MSKKNEATALIWKMSVGKNVKGGYICCPNCGRRLYCELTGAFTNAMIRNELGKRIYGECICGNPCVMIEGDYSGDKLSDNWEEQLKLSHEKEVNALKSEVSDITNRLGKLQSKLDEAVALNSVRGQRITDLTERMNKLKDDFATVSDKLERANAEVYRLTELLDHMRRVNDNLRDSMDDIK